MKLIQTTTVGTATTAIEFTSIPQDGTDLMLFLSGRAAATGDNLDAIIRFNDVTTGYNCKILQGAGTSISSQSTSNGRIATLPAASATANTFSSTRIDIPNYTSSRNKSYSADNATERNTTSLAYLEITAGLWSNTSAITKISFLIPTSVNFEVGSIISLYKITKGSDGIVTTSP